MELLSMLRQGYKFATLNATVTHAPVADIGILLSLW